MSFNDSYSNLERKLQNIKYSLDSLCIALEQYCDPHEPVETNTKLDDISLVESNSSYHTAIDNLSIASSFSYLTAIDHCEFDKLSADHGTEEHKSRSMIMMAKKTVSFSKYVTIMEVYSKTHPRHNHKDHMTSLRGKFVDYIYREKFYIKYKWQKFKNNVLKAHKNGKLKTDSESKSPKQSSKTITTMDKDKYTQTIDLKWFFEDFFENSLLETDVDENSVSIVKESYAVPLTNFNTAHTTQQTISSHGPSMKETNPISPPCTNDLSDKIQIQPKLYGPNNGLLQNPTNGIENNLLLKYLISKAQYPVQLKIATSIVKLDLPLWYQSSLIV